jgi:hypothetical protein
MMFNSTFNNVVEVSFIGEGSRSTMIKPTICDIAHVTVKLKPPPFSNMSVPSQESERLCICVLGVLSSPLSLIGKTKSFTAYLLCVHQNHEIIHLYDNTVTKLFSK